MNFVMDASSLIAFLKHEQGDEVVREILRNNPYDCHIHVINLCEIFYGFRRQDGESMAQKAMGILLDLVTLHSDIDVDFWQEVGRYKADLRRVSLADCFCIALAKRLGGSVVTTDHHEFDVIAKQDIIPVIFIR
jgi:PIN domain nuclease of toxin-antitoxin system